jgi:hypothetical protein
MKRRVSIVQLINYRSESGARLGRVNTLAHGFYYVYMVLRKIVNGGFLECHIDRLLADKLLVDVLPYGLTIQLAGALGWAGFGNCNCLGRREWDQLRALGGFLEQEVLDAAIHL